MNKYKITPSNSDKSVVVEAASLMEVIKKVKLLGIPAKITKITEVESSRWERKEFPTMTEAVAYGKAQGRGTVKAQNNQFVWYALRG